MKLFSYIISKAERPACSLPFRALATTLIRIITNNCQNFVLLFVLVFSFITLCTREQEIEKKQPLTGIQQKSPDELPGFIGLPQSSALFDGFFMLTRH